MNCVFCNEKMFGHYGAYGRLECDKEKCMIRERSRCIISYTNNYNNLKVSSLQIIIMMDIFYYRYSYADCNLYIERIIEFTNPDIDFLDVECIFMIENFKFDNVENFVANATQNIIKYRNLSIFK